MTPEQELTWNLLKNNYAETAHSIGKMLTESSEKEFSIKINDAFGIILDWPEHEGCRAVKTWLTYYNLPIEPDALEHFDKFDEKFGRYIQSHHPKIDSYEPPGR